MSQLFPSGLSLSQIQEDRNDDKRDSLEQISDVSTSLLQKLSHLQAKECEEHSSRVLLRKPFTIIMFFQIISLMNSLNMYLKLFVEIWPIFFASRAITFLILLLSVSFFRQPSENLAKLLASLLILSINSWVLPLNFDISLHSQALIQDLRSIILSLALYEMFLPSKSLKFHVFSTIGLSFIGLIVSRCRCENFFTWDIYAEAAFWVLLINISLFIKRKHETHINENKSKDFNDLKEDGQKILDLVSLVQMHLQESYDNLSVQNINKDDELAYKMKLMKFQALINYKNKVSLSPSHGIANPSSTNKSKNLATAFNLNNLVEVSPMSKTRAAKGKQMLSPTYKRLSRPSIKKSVLDSEKTILIQKIEAYDFAPGAEKIQKTKRWDLTPEDVDEIMSGILNKNNVFWLPNFMKDKKRFGNELNKKIVRQDSFSGQIGNEYTSKMFADDLAIIKDNKFELDLKFIDLNPLNDYLVNVCENWNYDVFLLHTLTNGNVIVEFGYCIFRKFQVQDCMKIENNSIVSNFLYNIQVLYRNNPYHNSMHAADVTNSIGFFLAKGMNQVFDKFEAACLVISALAHDVGHPGLNNAFLVATKSKYAIIYNDSSVLENYHSSTLFQIIVNTKCDVTSNLTEKEFRQFRKLCIGMILDTDLQRHFQILNKFKSLLGVGDIDMTDETNRHLALSVALKCADIGHGAKGLELHKKWSRRIIEEFFNQGDLELKHKMPISPICDRKADIAKSQEGFLKFIVLPLYESFEKFAKSEIISKNCSEQINKNLEYWDSQKNIEEKQQTHIVSFMEETKEIYNEIIKHSISKVSDDSMSCISFSLNSKTHLIKIIKEENYNNFCIKLTKKMGSLACCDKRLSSYFQCFSKSTPNHTNNINLKRMPNNRPQISSILIFNNGIFSLSEPNNPINEKSPRKQAILDMDAKLRLLKEQKDKKDLCKLSGKNLLKEVFS